DVVVMAVWKFDELFGDAAGLLGRGVKELFSEREGDDFVARAVEHEKRAGDFRDAVDAGEALRENQSGWNEWIVLCGGVSKFGERGFDDQAGGEGAFRTEFR